MLCLTGFLLLSLSVAQAQFSAEELASRYSLATSTSYAFPAATQANPETQNILVSDWSLSKSRIQDGEANLAFVQDPFPSGSTSPNGTVLRVTYPAGSFSHNTGGAQFYSLFNSATPFQTMMLEYEVAFDQNFDFVKGGKLPGLRGGSPNGCSGGNFPDGLTCFSARLMWRQNGNGEVYAYVPTPNNICSSRSMSCNDDFGLSISRGSFTLVPGTWNRITMILRLNTPGNVANGNILLYFNDVNVLNQRDLQFRSATNLSVNGMYFSTFFGGADASWATPNEVHSYFRNIRVWGGEQASNLTGQEVSAAQGPVPRQLLGFSLAAPLLVTFSLWSILA